VTAEQPRARRPWNKGLALTTTPTVGTVRRWMEVAVAEGIAVRTVAEPDGKPGRPPFMYQLSEAAREKARKEPGLPLAVHLERSRRVDNARKRRGMQRRAKKANALGQKADKARRNLTAAKARVAKVEAEAARLTLEIACRALTALDDADGNPSALLPEEVDVLTETGVATEEDGRLVLAGDWDEKLKRIFASGE
jgi:hypothetical protein